MKNEITREYLQHLAECIALTTSEKTTIDSQSEVLKKKIIDVFQKDSLKEVLVFGSYDRETLLSRKVYEDSDIDLLVVFEDKKLEAQSYLNKLKSFAENINHYKNNYQDHPSIVIELSKIKFELNPCYFEKGWFSDSYYIPKRSGTSISWIETDPWKLKNMISQSRQNKNGLIDSILLFKYWNVMNEKPYETYDVEKFVIRNFDYTEDIDYNFFKNIDALNFRTSDEVQTRLNQECKRLKDNIELLIRRNMDDHIEQELNKIVPIV